MKETLLKMREELGEHLIPGEDEFYSSLRPFVDEPQIKAQPQILPADVFGFKKEF